MKISLAEANKFIKEIFLHIGCTENESNIISEVLLSAEKRGIPSHGIIRIKDYLGLWEKKRITIRPQIEVVRETPTTLLIDGDNCLGMLAAEKAMRLCIEKASHSYTAWAAIRNSNHFGIAGYYSMMALEHDMIGISMTNANPLVAPTFSIDRLLGTNPLAVAIPAKNEAPFVADFATTPIARGKLEILEKSNKTVEYGFIQDKFGNPSNDPAILKDGGAILPLGGDYLHASHKGFCMSAIIDIFSSVLSGANFGPFVPPQVAYLEPNSVQPGKGLGHFFGAMRIDAFQTADEFKESMDVWIQTFKKARTSKEHSHIVIPGEPERLSEDYAEIHGIDVQEEIVTELSNTLKRLSIPISL
jgi:L-2-hydroxycarboxylate dehydrogenase (NAD+)